jgi:hypothetical protein
MTAPLGYFVKPHRVALDYTSQSYSQERQARILVRMNRTIKSYANQVPFVVLFSQSGHFRSTTPTASRNASGAPPRYTDRMVEKPPRRWFAFRLRTMFVLVALVALLSWVGVQLKWIADRHAFLKELQPDIWDDGERPVAPLGLRLFGEQGCANVALPYGTDPDVFARAKMLFPESQICAYVVTR